MLRTIATSLAQALAIMLGAELCWSLVAYFAEYHSYDLAPLLVLVLYPVPVAVAALRKHNALAELDRNRLVRGADLGLQLECGSGHRMSPIDREFCCYQAASN
jgi:hypothetical protein